MIFVIGLLIAVTVLHDYENCYIYILKQRISIYFGHSQESNKIILGFLEFIEEEKGGGFSNKALSFLIYLTVLIPAISSFFWYCRDFGLYESEISWSLAINALSSYPKLIIIWFLLKKIIIWFLLISNIILLVWWMCNLNKLREKFNENATRIEELKTIDSKRIFSDHISSVNKIDINKNIIEFIANNSEVKEQEITFSTTLEKCFINNRELESLKLLKKFAQDFPISLSSFRVNSQSQQNTEKYYCRIEFINCPSIESHCKPKDLTIKDLIDYVKIREYNKT